MAEEYLSSSASSCSWDNTHLPVPIGANSWLLAEERVQAILTSIQPTRASEHRRKEVIKGLHGLMRECFGIEVLPFGSVPLKTYLPDGDIDLTVVCHRNDEEDLAVHMCNFFAWEGQKDPQFVIENVEYVRAQVSVVKCTVGCIAVDISFNQMAGLSALCFLEQIDQVIGKDHLFKRSIILVKAWCYYESRILGALHGLIASYALDVLVLHILNLFHSSLNGPLSVLHRFLEYYSQLDWEKYCVSLNGQVPISSLPEVVVERPENDGSDLLLGEEFLKNEASSFRVSNWAQETSDEAFPLKHLNIIDPLKDNNNLGRSVSKANFHRIKSAFSYGARKLGDIMMLPQESIGQGLEDFFGNTLHLNGNVRRPNVRIPVPVFGYKIHEASDLMGDYDIYLSNLAYGQQYHEDSSMESKPRTSATQFNQDVVSQSKVEGFVPKAVQPSTAALGNEEILKFQVNDTEIPTSVDEKLKSRAMDTYFPNKELQGAGTFLPDIHAQGMFMLQETARLVLGKDCQENVKSRGTGPFIPKLCHKSGGATTKNLNMGVGKVYRRVETSSFIPNMGIVENMKSHRPNTRTSSCRKVQYRPLSTGLLLQTPKNEKVDVSSETGEKSSSSFDPPLEEFPLLHRTEEAINSKSPQPEQPYPVEVPDIVEAPQAQKSSPVSENVESGFVEPSLSPSVLPLSVASEGSEPAESSGNKKEMVPVQPYRLGYDEDFPSLSQVFN